MRDSIDWLEKNGRDDERKSIERVLDFRHESAAAGYRINIDLDNIEHLFSLAAAKPGAARTEDICLAIAATIDFAAQTSQAPPGRLRVGGTDGWPITAAWRRAATRVSASGHADFEDFESSVYDYYAATLAGLTANKMEAGKNVVITFNYDLVVEESLKMFDIPITYQLSGRGVETDPGTDMGGLVAFQILKLHGSMNWGQKPDGGVLLCRDYEHVRSHKIPPLLVPPTWRKNPTEALMRVWDAAVAAIAAATRIILLGFSIPPADQHFKYLLSVGLKDNSSLRLVRIVDPRARELQEQYETVFRGDQFKYGIVGVREKRTDEFFYDETEIGSIGRTLAHPGLNLVADDKRDRRLMCR